jgi:hypothetical protein
VGAVVIGMGGVMLEPFCVVPGAVSAGLHVVLDLPGLLLGLAVAGVDFSGASAVECRAPGGELAPPRCLTG